MDKRILAIVLAAACASEPAPKLLGGADGEDVPIDQTPEAHQRRARMNLTLNVGGTDQAFTVRFFAATAVVGECLKLLRADPGGMPFADATGNGIAGCSVPWDIVLPEGNTALPPSFTALPTEGALACEVAMCRAQVGLCVANKLMELSTSVAPTEFKGAVLGMPINTLKAVLPAPAPVDVTLAPAVEEQAVAYTEEAFHYSAWVATIAGENLRKSAGRDAPTGVCTAAQLNPPSLKSYPLIVGKTKTDQGDYFYGEAFAASLTEATVMAEEAARAAVKHHVSVADADFSRYKDKSIAARLAWSSKDVSRARAAHVILGGGLDQGLRGNPRGICAIMPPTGKVDEAIAFLRMTGANPRAVLDKTRSTKDLFEQGYKAAGTSDVPLRNRLGERLGDGALPTMAYGDFLSSHKLTDGDFRAAREQIAAEISAFSRGLTQTLPAIPIASTRDLKTGAIVPHTTSDPIYAAIANPPSPLSATEYRGLIQFNGTLQPRGPVGPSPDPGPDPLAGDGPPEITPQYARKGLAPLKDYAFTLATELIPYLGVSLPSLGTLAGGLGKQVEGRLESCYRYWAGTDEIRLRVFGHRNADELDVVVGEAGLRCAVSGTIEGAPCRLDDHRLPGSGIGTIKKQVAEWPDGSMGYRNYVELDVNLSYHAEATTIWLYVVKRAADRPAAPGSYVGMGVVPVTFAKSPAVEWQRCHKTPLDSDLENLVAEILTPDPKFCGRPAIDCSGMPIGQRVTLENELDDAHLDVEASWRVHLANAKTASEKADALGERMVAAGESIDSRIEDAEARVEESCGGAQTLSKIFWNHTGPACPTKQEGELCASPPTVEGATLGQVCHDGQCVQPTIGPVCPKDKERKPCDGIPGAAPGQVCLNGTCVAEAMETIRDAQDPLNECLGDSTIVPFVSLGTDRKCVWVDANGVVCGENPDKPSASCPFAASDTALCSPEHDPKCDGHTQWCDSRDAPAGSMPFYVKPLGIVPAPQEHAAGPDPTPPCAALAQLRDPLVEGERRRELLGMVRNGFLDRSKMGAIAYRIGWKAKLDNYSAVTVDGTEVFSTGDPFSIDGTPESESWPCGTSYEKRELGHTYTCTQNSTNTDTIMAFADSLFCSYSTECGATGSDIRRAFMNYRLGRAVVALRLLTKVPLDDSLQVPYNIYSATTVELDGGAADKTLYDQRAALVGSIPDFWSGTSRQPLFYGSAPCIFSNDANSDTTIWIDPNYGLNLETSVIKVYRTQCPENVNRAPNPSPIDLPVDADHSWVIFTSPANDPYISLEYDKNPEFLLNMWRGLDRGPRRVEQTAVLLDALQNLNRPTETLIRITWNKPSRKEWIPANTTSVQFPFRYITHGEALDALELACEVARLDEPSDCGKIPEIGGSEFSVRAAEDFLRCLARKTRESAQSMILADVPQLAIDALAQRVIRIKGEIGAGAADFASALGGIRAFNQVFEGVLQQFSLELKTLRSEQKTQELQAELTRLNKESTIASQQAACVGAIYQPIGQIANPWALAGGMINATITCGNTTAQIGIAIAMAAKQLAIADNQQAQRWNGINASMLQHAKTLTDAAHALEESANRLRAALARMENYRQKAQRALSTAMMMGDDAQGRQFAVNTVMRRRYNTLKVRYARSFEAAKRLAYLARRALEQRIGMDLSQMHKPTANTGRAPASWANEICVAKGMNYDEIRKEGVVQGNNGIGAETYHRAYLGDYVDEVERVMQSHTQDFPFSSAADVAVVSLRDDVAHTRQRCEVSINNLLAYSARLDVMVKPGAQPEPTPENDLAATESALPSVWDRVGCTPASADSSGACVSVWELPSYDAGNRPLTANADSGPVPGYRVTFARSFTGTDTSVIRSVNVVQRVPLKLGYYRLSWYGRAVGGLIGGTATPKHFPENAVTIRREGGGALAVTDLGPVHMTPGIPNITWPRYHQLFLADTDATYEIAIVPSDFPGEHEVDLGGLMLEDLSHSILGRPPVTARLPPSSGMSREVAEWGTRRDGCDQDRRKSSRG